MDLYFECNSGISGDMATGALLDLGADENKLNQALKSLELEEEFEYKITDVMVNSIKAKDFNVILKNHHHTHRTLEDIFKIIDKASIDDKSKELAKKIFNIIAKAESRVHNKNINEIHFHEVGAIDSIVDIISFSVLFNDLNPDNVYFSTLTEGLGTVMCQHGVLNVPVPAVCEILKEYKIPFKITDNNGEMITPTGAGIAASLYQEKPLPEKLTLIETGCGSGKRKYENPILRVMKIKGE